MVDTMFNIPVFSSFAEEMEHRITNGTRPRRGARTQQSEPSPVSCRIELLRGGSCRDDASETRVCGRLFISRTLHQRLFVLNKTDEIDRSRLLTLPGNWRLALGSEDVGDAIGS